MLICSEKAANKAVRAKGEELSAKSYGDKC
jgi:hypothetical protein